MDKRTLYVGILGTAYSHLGGLEPFVTEQILTAAFIPFGDIVDVVIPKDSSNYEGIDDYFAFPFISAFLILSS